MKEASLIVNEYNKIDFPTTKAALATVVQVNGSSYRRTGARMLILDNGDYFGGVSGGCLEKDVLRKGAQSIIKNKPHLLIYDTNQDDDHQIGIGLGCNGIIKVLINPLDNKNENNPVFLLSKVVATKEPGVIVSIIDADEDKYIGKTFLYQNNEQFIQSFDIKQAALFILHDIKNCLEHKASKTIIYNYGNNTITVFIEVILPTIQLLIYGNNYDIYPLWRIVKELGWNVAVIGNASKATMLLSSIAGCNFYFNETPPIDRYTAIVLMAHDYKTDLENFQNALKTKAFYIGLLGPKKRSQKMFEYIFNNTLQVVENTERIFAPAGLDIGANSPEEIALSIIAEIKSCDTGRTGAPLRLRPNAIHTD